MRSRRRLVPFLCAALALPLAACREDGPVVPAATTRHIMTGTVEPAAKVVFEAAAEAPSNAGSWRDVQTNASLLADSGNRLIRVVRGGEKAAWVQEARIFAAAAGRAASAAAAKDAAALAAAGDALYESCESCHRAFQTKHIAEK